MPRLPRETNVDVTKCHACGCQEGEVVCEQVVRGQVVCEKVVRGQVVCEEVVCEQVVCGQVV